MSSRISRAGPGAGLRICLLLGTLLAAGCATAPAPGVAVGDIVPLEISPEAAARAAELLALARSVEPEITGLLTEAVELLDLELYGLPFRLKGRESLERKIQTAMLDDGVAASEVVIDDVVRYTVLIEDDPPGRYGEAAADILRRLEAAGYPIELVKNYWPPGDSYSGLNCVLSTPEGLPWELQFHTLGSLAAKQEGHELYETLRLPTTPRRVKRRIFDRLSERWSWVIVPEGILEPRSDHPAAEIILYPRP